MKIDCRYARYIFTAKLAVGRPSTAISDLDRQTNFVRHVGSELGDDVGKID